MSNKSRARFRHEPDDTPEPDPYETEYVEGMADAFAEMEDDRRAGLSKFADLILRDRERTLNQVAAVTDRQEEATPYVPSGPLREPTAYEAAILEALGNRTTVIDRTHVGGRAFEVPVSVASGGIYGGTVEPERVAARRRRNKAARAARRGRRIKVRGRVYRSRFGYPIRVPGISRGGDAEAVDA